MWAVSRGGAATPLRSIFTSKGCPVKCDKMEDNMNHPKHYTEFGISGKMEDNVNHPKHYTESGILCEHCNQPIECINIAKNFNFTIGNAIKYLWRHKKKGSPVQDLQKARWYINKEIEGLSESKSPE